MLVWLMAAASHVSRLSLMVLQVSSRDWGPVLGTDMDRMDSVIIGHVHLARNISVQALEEISRVA